MQATRDDNDQSVIITLTPDEARQLLLSLNLTMTHADTLEHEQFALGLSVELRCAGVERVKATREVTSE